MVTSVTAAGIALIVAQAMPVPLELQAAILTKVLAYDQTLEQRGGGRLVLIVQAGKTAEAEVLARAFANVGTQTKVVTVAELDAAAAGAAAIYVWPDVPATEAARLAQKHGLLTMTGQPALVANGTLAVGLDLNEARRPQIIVHMARLKTEGHQLAAAVLRLAKRIE